MRVSTASGSLRIDDDERLLQRHVSLASGRAPLASVIPSVQRPSALTAGTSGAQTGSVRFGLTYRFVIAALALVVAAASASGAEEKVPRFASLRADEVNLRTGPGERYPVEWVYQRKGLPVEVTAQSDVWRRVRNSDGTEGWVHERMLTSSRSQVVTGAPRTLRSEPAAAAHSLARASARRRRPAPRMQGRVVPRRDAGHQGLAAARRILGRLSRRDGGVAFHF